jgi:hypothetical protein
MLLLASSLGLPSVPAFSPALYSMTCSLSKAAEAQGRIIVNQIIQRLIKPDY